MSILSAFYLLYVQFEQNLLKANRFWNWKCRAKTSIVNLHTYLPFFSFQAISQYGGILSHHGKRILSPYSYGIIPTCFGSISKFTCLHIDNLAHIGKLWVRSTTEKSRDAQKNFTLIFCDMYYAREILPWTTDLHTNFAWGCYQKASFVWLKFD